MSAVTRFISHAFVPGAMFVLAVLLIPAASHGQSAGTRVRLKTARLTTHFYGERARAGDWVTGTIASIDGRFVRLKLPGSDAVVSVARDSIVQMERSLGIKNRGRSGRFVGLVGGALVGGAVGAALSFVGECGEKNKDIGCGGYTVVLALVGLAGGGVAGTKVGSKVGRGIEYEAWERVPGWEKTLSGAGYRQSYDVVLVRFRF